MSHPHVRFATLLPVGLSLAVALTWPGALGCRLTAGSGDSSRDGGQPSDAESNGDGALPAATLAYFDELEIYKKGGTIPASGKRGAITVTVGSGGSHTISMAGSNSTERLHMDYTGHGAFTLTSDFDGNGKVDEEMTATTTGGTTTTIWNRDDNLGGVMNWRATMTMDSTAGVSATVEQIPFGSITLAEVSSYSGAIAMASGKCASLNPLAIESGDDCDAIKLSKGLFAPKPNLCQMSPTTSNVDQPKCTGTNGKPTFNFDGLNQFSTTSLVRPQSLFPNQSTPYSVITRGPMKCDSTQTAILAQAVAMAGPDFDAAVVNSLNASWASVDATVATQGVMYGCEQPSCSPDGTVAVTSWPQFVDSPNVWITSIQPSIIALGANVLEEIIIHEWFHTVIGHIPDATGGDERDQVYACSRVANGGKSWNAGFYLGICCDASSARDFAMCADPTNKLQFGVYNMFVETNDGLIEKPNSGFTGYSDQVTPAICVDDSSPPKSSNCQCYLEQTPAYCDQTPLTQDQALKLGVLKAAGTLTESVCCETCPASTPYAGTLCGTAGPGTECPPMDDCSTISQGGLSPDGPTFLWRNPLPAILCGQAKSSDVDGLSMTVDCSQVMGFPY
jgi:hypothetical protein